MDLPTLEHKAKDIGGCSHGHRLHPKGIIHKLQIDSAAMKGYYSSTTGL